MTTVTRKAKVTTVGDYIAACPRAVQPILRKLRTTVRKALPQATECISAGGQGWACNRGFTQVAGLCMVDSDVLPSEGAFEVFDGQWRCRSGYHRAGRFCLPGLAPEHAAFVGEGDRWECDWGFQKIGSGDQAAAACVYRGIRT